MAAVLKGISDEGGLFVPTDFPQITDDMLEKFGSCSYPETAAGVLSLLFDIPKDTLLKMTKEAYSGFSSEDTVPLVELTDNEYIIELFHGPTLAFKDVALQMLPRLMGEALRRSNDIKNVMILTATSGDTGKAALEGFKDVDGTKIVVFYPEDGVSEMQKRQMLTQDGKNTLVCAVRGNFDDAQTGVKNSFPIQTLTAGLKQAELTPPPQTRLISEDSHRKSFITYTAMRFFSQTAELKRESPLTSAFPPATSAISLRHITHTAWVFPFINLYALQIKTTF